MMSCFFGLLFGVLAGLTTAEGVNNLTGNVEAGTDLGMAAGLIVFAIFVAPLAARTRD